jgi:hypothetical protein
MKMPQIMPFQFDGSEGRPPDFALPTHRLYRIRTGYSRSVSDFRRVTRRGTGGGTIHRAAHARVCDKPRHYRRENPPVLPSRYDSEHCCEDRVNAIFAGLVICLFVERRGAIGKTMKFQHTNNCAWRNTPPRNHTCTVAWIEPHERICGTVHVTIHQVCNDHSVQGRLASLVHNVER